MPPELENAATSTLEALNVVKTIDQPVRRRLWTRPNRIVGAIIPWFLLAIYVTGWRAVFYYGLPYIEQVLQRPRLAVVYTWTSRFFFVTLAYNFLLVYLAPRGHSRPPHDPPREVLERSVVYEVCSMEGDLPRCYQDNCTGNWIPARARHCKDCGYCCLAFDHCCPWFGPTCISGTRTYKPFLLFLISAIFLVGIGEAPLFPICAHHIRLVLSTSWHSEELSKVWWSRRKSWLIGPVWRYAGGLILSYRHHQRLGHSYKNESLRPSLIPLFVVVFATLVFLVAVVMSTISISHVLQGKTTIEVERARRSRGGKAFDASRLLWVPVELDNQSGKWTGRIVRIPPDAPIYDVGWRGNWQAVMGRKWYHWINSQHMGAYKARVSHMPPEGICPLSVE